MKLIKEGIVNIVAKVIIDKWRECIMANKLDELKEMIMESNFYPKKEEKKVNPVVIVLAVIGIIAVIAGIAAAVYYFLIPEDSEDFEDFEDFEDMDDFEDEIADDLEGDE